MSEGFLDTYIEEWKNDPEFRKEEIILGLNERICELMEEKKISRTELANRIKVNRAFITRILNGSQNITIGTLVRIALALDADLKIDIILNKMDKMEVAERKLKEKKYLLVPNFSPSINTCLLKGTNKNEMKERFLTQMEDSTYEIEFSRSTATSIQTAFSHRRGK